MSMTNSPSLKQQQFQGHWVKTVDPKSGRTVYANTLTRKTQWEKPEEWIEEEEKKATTGVMNSTNDALRQQQQQQQALPNTAPRPPPQQQQPQETKKSFSMVLLHVYDLQPDPIAHQQQTQQPLSFTDRAMLAMSGILPTIGMGAHHTTLEVMGRRYTFAGGNAGGVIVGGRNDDNGRLLVPPIAKFKETIPLGPTFRSADEIANIVQTLSSLFFTTTAYDILHRNCNHFTETLAMALIMTEPPPHDKARLLSYPEWLNRLANTGAMVMSTTAASTNTIDLLDDESNNNTGGNKSSCNILQEATIAAGF